jgi:regulator of sigma E protease
LPIPMLDGGYVVFILYEMITRRQPSERFMEITNYFGMIFLLGLMLYANGNDIYRSFFK